MGNKIKKILKNNHKILVNLKPIKEYRTKYLDIFHWHYGKTNVSLRYFDNGYVKFSVQIDTRDDGFFYMNDFDKAKEKIDLFREKNNIKLVGLNDVINYYKSKGLVMAS